MFFIFEETAPIIFIGSAPIDGHHPMDIELKVYPHLGHKLTDKDIGEYVLRTFPFESNGYYDWSYIPHRINGLNSYKYRLVSLEDGVVKISSFAGHVFTPGAGDKHENWNDGNWCTKKEWTKHQKSLLEKETEKETEKSKVEDVDVRLNLPNQEEVRHFNGRSAL